MPERLRIAFAGSGEFGVPTLQALLERHDVVRVYTQPDRPAGRGRTLTPTPVAAFADSAGRPAVRTGDFNRDFAVDPLDVLVVIAFGQKLSAEVVARPRLGAINLHASLLPRHRGAAPIHWAILAGDRVTGNSVIRLAQTMDAGAVLGQSSLSIGEQETTGELHDRLARDGIGTVLTALDQLAARSAVEIPQDPALATRAPKLSREDSRLDFSRPAEEVARRIRGMSPWPGCRVRVLDAAEREVGRMTLLRAVDCPDGGRPTAPGRIREDGTIGTALGVIQIVDLVPEGRRPMSIAEYSNGRPWPMGGSLESIS